MADIVITEFMSDDAVGLLAAKTHVLYGPDLINRPADLTSSLADCRALIVRNRTQVDRRLLDTAPRLKLVGRLGVGLDNIDLAACAQRGVAVHPATGANDDSVAEYVVCAAMMLVRRAFLANAAMIEGRWPREGLIGSELAGKTAGLIGLGGTARATAARLAKLGMIVSATDPNIPETDPVWSTVNRTTFDGILTQSDVVSLHVPLTPKTRHLVDSAAVSKLKQTAVLINASRGGIVDEEALIHALRNGQLAGAALDVFEHEPLTAENGAKFRDIPNLILTPHIAGVTADSNVRVSAKIAQLVLAGLDLERS